MSVYILGGSQSDFERNITKEGKSFIALLKEIVNDGFSNAGFTYDQLRYLNKENKVGCFVGNAFGESFVKQGHFGAFLTAVHPSFEGVPSARYEAACASGSAAIEAAINSIKAGVNDIGIVIGFEIMKTVDSPTCANILGLASYYEKESKSISMPFPNLFNKFVDAVLVKYPNIEENRLMNALARISCINYENAKRNPNSQTRKWYMSYQHASSRGIDSNRIVAGRLSVSDCSQVTDGASIVILASDEFVYKNGCKTNIVIKGVGHRNAHILLENKIHNNFDSKYILPWTRQAVLDAYKQSGLTVDDIDCFETHDCFTISEYMAISCFGITEPGYEYFAIEDGSIAFNGRKPINPSGGLIGCGHPVGATGVRMLLDCYKQVTNNAENYQIKNAKNAMMLNIGGTATTNYVFIVGVKE